MRISTNKTHQGKAGGDDRRSKEDNKKDGQGKDDGGHLIATIFNGSGKVDNIVAMDSNLNRGEWKRMENMWAEALEEGEVIKVKITG